VIDVTPDPLVVFAQNMRARRKALTLTQEAASDRAQMNLSYWGRIERGTVEPGVRTVVRIARALQTTPDALLTGMGLDASDARADHRTPPPHREPADAAGPAHRRDPVSPTSSLTRPPFSPALAFGSAVVYFPTNFLSPCAPAHTTPPPPAIPPLNIIAVLLSTTTPPISPLVPPTT
jgi:transcriptional regulator with XRE-family HTH domain